MPSMALKAMRTKSVTGRRSSGQREAGISASHAPWAALKSNAPSVTSLAVNPRFAKFAARGRSNFWNCGLRS
jgi:hypothetical protein